MKKILVIQDLSCVGKCSVTVALPILSAMGINCSALPTAVLSTHTGFPGPHVVPLTEHISAIGSHFDALGVTFDAVTTGYLSDPEQAEAVLEVMTAFDCPVILDPAMADHGKLYYGFDEAYAHAMGALCGAADIALPNITEASFLTGMEYKETYDRAYIDEIIAKGALS